MCDYNFNTNRSIPGWESEELGVGMPTGRKHSLDCTYVVARCRPFGNVYGQFSENVLKGT